MVDAEWGAGEQAPRARGDEPFSTRNRAVDFGKPDPGAPARRGQRRVQHRRHRADRRPTASCATPRARSPRAAQRRRQGARDLRVDRRQHLPRSEDARLRHRRHQGDARDAATSAASAPTSTRSSSAWRARSACRRATSTACAWPSPQFGYRSLGAGRRTSRARSTAAPRCSSPATAGCRSIRPTCARWCSRRRPRPTTLARSDGRRGARQAVRRLGNELAGLQRGARRQAARLERRAASRSSCTRRPRRAAPPRPLDPDNFKYTITAREIKA